MISGDIIRQVCAEKGITVVKGNVRPNPIHILLSAPAYLSPAKIAQYLKGGRIYCRGNSLNYKSNIGDSTYGGWVALE
ncbi:MAG: hypothetical protein FJ134_14940 [Deltaproteobacteria bacterium]|nr:hypothetical protein [Deltaproteobacteria bacterium]